MNITSYQVDRNKDAPKPRLECKIEERYKKLQVNSLTPDSKTPQRITVKEVLDLINKDKYEIAKLQVSLEQERELCSSLESDLISIKNFYLTKIESLQKEIVNLQKENNNLKSNFINFSKTMNDENNANVKEINELTMLVRELQSKTSITKVKEYIKNLQFTRAANSYTPDPTKTY